MSRLVVHIGMPMTGSSSIQETLFAKGMHEGWRYADLGVPNHSGVLLSIFSTNPLTWQGQQTVGSGLDEAKEVNQRFEKRLEEVKGSAGQQILSGEGVFHLDEAGLERLRAYFQEAFDTIEVIGYVRPPASFMASAFVQLVKNRGQARLSFQKLWPRYRAKLEKFDRVFGREHVTLRPFCPHQLTDGDIVQDFCQFLGAPIDPAEVRSVNDSLSLEAAAALFVYRREGPCYQAYPGNIADNNRLVNLLAGFGEREFRFSDALVRPVMEREAADLEWIETRLGVPLRDAGSTDAGAICCEQDLLDVAEKSREGLSDFVREQTQQVDPTPQRIANWVEKLRVTVSGRASNGVTPSPYEGRQFFTPEQVRRLTGEKMGPATALRELAVAYERKNLPDEALTFAQAALKLRPDSADLRQLNERLRSAVNRS
ncbi:tetratricopeptide repeat protein [Halomonas sp. DN3]|uniref:tetratricopeptide repeat protein n=1 Tax=Halomonas sp. DN3 TaxID=2953657 RepID=UPI00209D62D9|nr:tetratricopeptide repeat protein [Halomonas sp. DN3]USZ49718.1 tetratricopeptide repeat protein [Halomonas sp. DN3]